MQSNRIDRLSTGLRPLEITGVHSRCGCCLMVTYNRELYIIEKRREPHLNTKTCVYGNYIYMVQIVGIVVWPCYTLITLEKVRSVSSSAFLDNV